MDSHAAMKVLESIVDEYRNSVRHELHDRMMRWTPDLSCAESHEVVGSLLARIVTLATQLANAPQMWNGHIAPVLLRTIVDAHITLAWILVDPTDRSRKFILYGLGQEKLCLEHLRNQMQLNDPLLENADAWLASQRYPFLTEVNLGSWSGIDTRRMAEQADCLDLHRHAYIPFSAAVHSMWNHVGKYNLSICENPLHRYHGIPDDPDIPIDPDYLYRAAKYVAESFSLFDSKTSVQSSTPSAFTHLVERMSELGSNLDSDGEDPE